MRFRITLLLFIIAPQIFGQAPIFNPLKESNQARQHVRPITGILGAFPPELVLLQARLSHKKDTIIQHIHFIEGVLEGRQVVVAQTGIGKVNAAIVTTLLIEYFQPAEIIFTGIAGGVNPALAPGDIVIGTRAAYHDYGTLRTDSMERRATRNPFTMQENPVYFPCDSGLVQLALQAASHTKLDSIGTSAGNRLPRISAGTIVTGDVFVASHDITRALHRDMQADATEMEGAAVAQSCWQQHVPFLIIRSLSDDAGNNASELVRNFYELAARNAASLVLAIVEQVKAGRH